MRACQFCRLIFLKGDALADEVQCLLDGVALGVLLPQQSGECVSEGIGVTVGRLRRILDGLEPCAFLQLRRCFIPRGIVGLHEAGKGVGIGNPAMTLKYYVKGRKTSEDAAIAIERVYTAS